MIETKGLTKYYKNVCALDALDLTVEAGEVFGYIGPNGAGKTTTLRMLCGLLRATSGQATVSGVEVTKRPGRVKGLVGYLPHAFGGYPEMSVWEYLDFFGAAYRIKRKVRRSRIDEVLGMAGGSDLKDYAMGSLSQGMRQKVGIAKTMLHDPAVLLLDEPTAGLDPLARVEVKNLVQGLKAAGKTVMISSHILPELETICDRVGVLEAGKLLATGTVDEILEQVRPHRAVELEVSSGVDEARACLTTDDRVANVEVFGNVVRFEFIGSEREMPSLLELLLSRQVGVVWCREVRGSLEEAYVKISGGQAPDPAEDE